MKYTSNYKGIGQHKAQIIGTEIEKIRVRNGGQVKPADIVEEARRHSSRLHQFFEWDDKKAADKWRIEQAKLYLRTINVVITGNKSVRAFHNVNIIEESGGGDRFYVSVGNVMDNVDYRQQVVGYALDQIETWRERHKMYSELRPIFRGIKEARKRVRLRRS